MALPVTIQYLNDANGVYKAKLQGYTRTKKDHVRVASTKAIHLYVAETFLLWLEHYTYPQSCTESRISDWYGRMKSILDCK